MSPVRNVSQHLGDVMRRSEERGAQSERRRLVRRAQSVHAAAHPISAGLDFRDCREQVCVALADLLVEPGEEPEPAGELIFGAPPVTSSRGAPARPTEPRAGVRSGP